jgi:hypothetical protein
MKKLKELTWAEIADISATQDAKKQFKVGDTKEIELITGEKVELVILGFNHDDQANKPVSAGITFGLKNLLDGEFEMNAYWTNVGGWEKSKMRTVYMERFFRLLPKELQDVIIPVLKKTAGDESNDKIVESTDKLFLFSEKEVTGDNAWSLDGEGNQYEYFKDKNARIKSRNGKEQVWWLRSPYTTNSDGFRYVFSSGVVSNSLASYSFGVCFGFCV